MSTLDLSENGPSITRSYNNLVSSPPSNNPSPTYASWALYSVSAPLQNAFVLAGPGKDSILKVQSTGEGELSELIEEFNEGKVQFAFVKVKDPNTGLGKFALIGWCGEGVPERVKGYFNGHLSSVSKILHGYHVQITARNDGDLTPESIITKIENASGAKYSESTKPKPAAPAQPAPPVATKPLYLNKPSFPSKVTAGSSFNSKPRVYGVQSSGNVDNDGWGEDAPPVTRSQLEKVSSAYKPTKVDINALRAQPSDTTSGGGRFDRPEPVRGAYQPIGKVDIAEIRRQANAKEERPEPVKGAYVPIGKVDIAAIRAQAKPRVEEKEVEPAPAPVSQRAAAFSQPAPSERLTSLPKPKPAKKFGSGAPSFGTKPPTPGVFGAPPAAQVGTANKDFASQGGKTPAQIWAEKKARERGLSGASETTPPSFSPSYTGVSATHTGRSAASNDGGVSNLASRFSAQKIDDAAGEPASSVSDLRNKFAKPIASPVYPERAASPPPPSPPVSTRPAASYERPASPETPPRVATPPGFEVKGSPIRIAMPVARTDDNDIPPIEPERAPSPAPVRQSSPEPAPRPSQQAGAVAGGLTAIAQYDYEKAEDNEIGFVEGETISNIDQVDDDWWEGTNAAGERGLFPANYVELAEAGASAAPAAQAAPQVAARVPSPEPQAAPAPTAAAGGHKGVTATAEYDYEAAEDNELSFPEGATIVDIEFPDEDWWSGSYQGRQGLFPANYVKLNQ